MELNAPFRWARKKDCPRIAELFSISSGGVADYVWSTLDRPGLSLLEIGAERYAREAEESVFSYRNCVVAELDGAVVGMLVSFPMEPEPELSGPEPEDRARDPGGEGAPPSPGRPDVLAPYGELEVPGSYYICGMAFLADHRGRGLGTRFLGIARGLARDQGLKELSLLVFEQNSGAVRLYERTGFKVIDRRPVVPHALIRYTGDVLLMTAPV